MGQASPNSSPWAWAWAKIFLFQGLPRRKHKRKVTCTTASADRTGIGLYLGSEVNAACPGKLYSPLSTAEPSWYHCSPVFGPGNLDNGRAIGNKTLHKISEFSQPTPCGTAGDILIRSYAAPIAVIGLMVRTFGKLAQHDQNNAANVP